MIAYVFKSPVSEKETIEIIRSALESIGGKFDGRIGRWRTKTYITIRPCKFHFYFHEKDGHCNVRASCSHPKLRLDDFWNVFVAALIRLKPNMDFGINAVTPHYIVAVLNMSGDTEQVHYSRTSGGTSLGGFLLGGLAFGAPGAIVGGMSGTQVTHGTTKTMFSNNVLVRILWNNGCITESTVYKNSPMYHEIMNMIS